jgi:stress response protein YsnF
MSESSKIGTKTNPTDLAVSSSSSSSSSPEIRTIEEPSTVTDGNRDTNPSIRPDYILPLVGEKYSLSKRIVVDEIKIEKRWFTNTKRLQVPVQYEVIYLNDEELESYKTNIGGLLSKLKDKIKDNVSEEDRTNVDFKNKNAKVEYYSRRKIRKRDEQHQEQQYSPKSTICEQIPLVNNSNLDETSEIEKVIPIWGEEIVVNKRTVKIGEIVIKKYKVTQNRKVELDITKEKLTIEYPDGRIEKIVPT